MNFFTIRQRTLKNGVIEVYPDFHVSERKEKDFMVRGHDFYAVWNEATGMWSQKENDVSLIVDNELRKYVAGLGVNSDDRIVVRTMDSFSSKSWKEYRDYAKSIPDNFVQLDEKLTFDGQEIKRTDYVSHKLPYALVDGDYSAWDELIGELYSPEEREKIEWAIGAVVSGDSRKIQKFLVFYGSPGTGKGTVMEIIAKLFEGYLTTFSAQELTSKGNTFATDAFRNNPLVGIQQDGDLSHIEDNTRLNSIVSHELMLMHEKYKASYMARVNCFLFLGSNKPVKITDAQSGLIRRLIDVYPAHTEESPIPGERYQELMSRIEFEKGAIAKHCLDVYQKLGRHRYSGYKPTNMMYKTDVFFNFVEDSYKFFKDNTDGISANTAYERYIQYCDKSGITRRPIYQFREELKNYFSTFKNVGRDAEGKQVRSWYTGFKEDKFVQTDLKPKIQKKAESWLVLDKKESLLDILLADQKAQYANTDGTPTAKWDNVTTTLHDIDTSKTHYVMTPAKLIGIDFDLKNEKGEKDAKLNLEAASKWKPTYAEFSNGGQGIHLEYWYDGDETKLGRIFSEGIEIKVNTGKQSLRRRVSLCNDIPVAHISGGLPLKEEKVIDWDGVVTERGIIKTIEAALRKEHHGATKPEIDFIFKILEDAYASGVTYDVTKMRRRVTAFAQKSTHNKDYCLKKCVGMKWRSEDSKQKIEEDQLRASGMDEDAVEDILTQRQASTSEEETPFTFFDIEVKPNVLLVVWKLAGEGQPFHRMWDPTPAELEQLFKMRLAGYNCRKYDNHILYGRYTGDSIPEVYERNVRIIDRHDKDAMFAQAYGVSALDIFDMCSKKQSLKKWEIELGIHHQEHEFPWDQPITEDQKELLAQYCENDVAATEAVFNARQADWTARKILASLSGLTVNETTNQHTTRIIFGGNKNPQGEFNYRNMGDESQIAERYHQINPMDSPFGAVDPSHCCFTKDGKPVFPGYSYEGGKSIYREEEVGEGGYVYAEPGIYRNVALLDIASMHPSSIVAENLFGDQYTERFRQILQARILIKHGEFDKARHILDGKLAPFLDDEGSAKDLAQALKIAINSVYGLTSAKFTNPFRDIRNVDNIVAKRGALFMVNLKHEVQKRGFIVAHIKTDSIKIPDATPDIIQFVMDYGRMYGYNFEHEATYDRMCLVNDAVYIARYSDGDENGKHKGQWTATGAQFQQPYIFKTLFSHEPITFDDLCETKSVTSGALYLDFGTEEEPKYSFVGRVGQFCPMRQGGGRLVREKDGKYYAATGTKGYFWQQSELVRGTAMEEDIDRSYYNRLVDEAVKAIGKYGDAEGFMA